MLPVVVVVVVPTSKGFPPLAFGWPRAGVEELLGEEAVLALTMTSRHG